MAAPKEGRAPGWGKEAVLRELESGLSLVEVCAKYAIGVEPSTLRRDVLKWRETGKTYDERFDAEYKRIVGEDNVYPRGDTSKELLPENADWRVAFCEEFAVTKSRELAAAATPHDYRTIYRKLNKDDSLYDAEFAEMVHLVQMSFCAAIESDIIKSATNDLLPAKDRAWIGFKVLERQDPKRWGRQVEMIHSGTIKHETQPAQLQLPREQRLAALASELKQFMLPADTQSAGDVIDVEPETVSVQS